MSRWFTRHEELMTSADKLVFALTTQWGANGPRPNILPMIEFARKQGYTVSYTCYGFAGKVLQVP